MAHFKRKKCRKNAIHAMRGSTASWRAKNGLKPVRREPGECWYPKGSWHRYKSMMHSHPAWFDRTFHTPLYRAANKRAERAIMRGADPDEVEIPVWGRPKMYYW